MEEEFPFPGYIGNTSVEVWKAGGEHPSFCVRVLDEARGITALYVVPLESYPEMRRIFLSRNEGAFWNFLNRHERLWFRTVKPLPPVVYKKRVVAEKVKLGLAGEDVRLLRRLFDWMLREVGLPSHKYAAEFEGLLLEMEREYKDYPREQAFELAKGRVVDLFESIVLGA